MAANIACAGGDDDDDDSQNSEPADDDLDSEGDDDAGDDAAAPYYPPDGRGPYEVGVQTHILRDPSRHEWLGDRDRTLPLEVWYPSTGEGGRLNGLPDMVGPLPIWGEPLIQLIYGDIYPSLWAFQTSAYRDADAIGTPDAFPVIFFSHGFSAIRFQNFTMCEHLASHGFIVVAPDHYGNAIFTNIPGEDVVFINLLAAPESFIKRTQDVEFVFDTLQAWRAAGDPDWTQAMDLERFGVMGHSLGGYTTFDAGRALDFVDAIAPLSPMWVGDFDHSFDRPMLVMEGTADRIVGAFSEAVRRAYDIAESTRKLHLDLLGAGHYGPSDACTLVPPWIGAAQTGCGFPDLDPEDRQHDRRRVRHRVFQSHHRGRRAIRGLCVRKPFSRLSRPRRCLGIASSSLTDASRQPPEKLQTSGFGQECIGRKIWRSESA
ncbi:MAG: dienelactone hydrolase family protein [Deltaproteobacteria bacterium]|nr:dienelactone hydrolase family protein [Deltaproteobacteria bacterium]